MLSRTQRGPPSRDLAARRILSVTFPGGRGRRRPSRREPEPGATGRDVAQLAHFAHVHLQHDDAEEIAVLPRFAVPLGCRRGCCWVVGGRRPFVGGRDDEDRWRGGVFRFAGAGLVRLQLDGCRAGSRAPSSFLGAAVAVELGGGNGDGVEVSS